MVNKKTTQVTNSKPVSNINTTNNTKASGIEHLIEKLAQMVSSHGLTEIEIDQGDQYIRVSKKLDQVVQAYSNSTPMVNGALQNNNTAASAAVEAKDAGRKPLDLANNPNVLLSPMVGTIYRRSSPEAADFKAVGDIVKKGETVLLIEAMKVFSPIKAHKDGRVVEFFIEGGKPVEYNQPLMVIE